jgi:hypothetical protein
MDKHGESSRVVNRSFSWSIGLGKNGKIPRAGVTPGWHYAVGTAVRLDGLDRIAARTLASEYGVAHVALSIAYSDMRETGLGVAHKLNLSDRTWAAGLGFDF